METESVTTVMVTTEILREANPIRPVEPRVFPRYPDEAKPLPPFVWSFLSPFPPPPLSDLQSPKEGLRLRRRRGTSPAGIADIAISSFRGNAARKYHVGTYRTITFPVLEEDREYASVFVDTARSILAPFETKGNPKMRDPHASPIPFSLSHLQRPLLKRQEDLGPQLARFTDVVRQADICHAGLGAAEESFELRDEVFEAEGFAGGLGGAGFEHGVDDVDMEMVVCWLICGWGRRGD